MKSFSVVHAPTTIDHGTAVLRSYSCTAVRVRMTFTVGYPLTLYSCSWKWNESRRCIISRSRTSSTLRTNWIFPEEDGPEPHHCLRKSMHTRQAGPGVRTRDAPAAAEHILTYPHMHCTSERPRCEFAHTATLATEHMNTHTLPSVPPCSETCGEAHPSSNLVTSNGAVSADTHTPSLLQYR